MEEEERLPLRAVQQSNEVQSSVRLRSLQHPCIQRQTLMYLQYYTSKLEAHFGGECG